MNRRLILFLSLPILALAGCATTGSNTAPSTSSSTGVTADGDITDPSLARAKTQVSKTAATIKDGTTTKMDIVRKLGLYFRGGTDSAGRKTATWTGKKSSTTGMSYIPGAAFIPGAIVDYNHSLTVVLDANDVVVSHQFLETTKSKTGLGFSYGN